MYLPTSTPDRSPNCTSVCPYVCSCTCQHPPQIGVLTLHLFVHMSVHAPVNIHPTVNPRGQGHFSQTAAIVFIFEPKHDKINKMSCAPSEDSDQPGHPPVWSGLSLSAWRTRGSLASHWAQATTLIRVGWSESSLGAQFILLVLSCTGSFRMQIFQIMYSNTERVNYLDLFPVDTTLPSAELFLKHIVNAPINVYPRGGVAGIPWGLDQPKITSPRNLTEHIDTGRIKLIKILEEITA